MKIRGKESSSQRYGLDACDKMDLSVGTEGLDCGIRPGNRLSLQEATAGFELNMRVETNTARYPICCTINLVSTLPEAFHHHLMSIFLASWHGLGGLTGVGKPEDYIKLITELHHPPT